MKVKVISGIIVLFLLLQIDYSQTHIGVDSPQRIILNLTEKPATSIAVTFRMEKEFDDCEVQYAEATDWKNFKDNIKTISAKKELFKAGDKNVFHYSAVIDGLKPNTVYVYRVGGDNNRSEWNQFRTASENKDPFTFVYLGDAQNDIREHVSRVLRETFRNAGEASFWLFGGDLVTKPQDDLWGELFDAAGFIPATTPFIMVPGNHEVDALIPGFDGKRVSKIWNAHFTLPENGVKELEETSYFIDYQGVRFIMLNSNEMLSAQAEWMDSLLADNPNNWTVITLHHPLYSGSDDRDNLTTRNKFLSVIDKYNIDLVLQGHDHVYARSHKIKNSRRVNPGEKGTVYVTSVCGPKAYKAGTTYKDLMEKTGDEIQLFQVIKVDGKKLSYKSYTTTGKLYDSFELEKE